MVNNNRALLKEIERVRNQFDYRSPVWVDTIYNNLDSDIKADIKDYIAAKKLIVSYMELWCKQQRAKNLQIVYSVLSAVALIFWSLIVYYLIEVLW